MPNFFGMGWHFHVENWYTDTDFDAAINHLKKTKAAWCNVTAGSKPDRAMILAQRISSETSTRVMYRLRFINDDGIWTRMSPETWYNDNIAPIKDWIKRFKIVVVVDNESIQDDMRPYAKWMASAMRLAGKDGISLAVGRFSTGNPDDGSKGIEQYAQLDELWDALAYWNTVGGVAMYWSPNEYFDVTPEKSGGNVNRYRKGWDRCKAKGLPNPPTVIGEFGLAHGFDPHKGWRDVPGLSGAKYFEMYLWHYQQWFEPQQVAVCGFAWSRWPLDKQNGFNAGDDRDFIQALETYAEKVLVMPPSIPVPKPPTVEIPVVVVPPIPPALVMTPEQIAIAESWRGEMMRVIELHKEEIQKYTERVALIDTWLVHSKETTHV